MCWLLQIKYSATLHNFVVNLAFIFYLLVVSSCARGQLLGMTSLLSLWTLEVNLRSAGSQQVLCPHSSCWPCQTVWLSMADLELNSNGLALDCTCKW